MANKKICVITYMRRPEHCPPLYNTVKSLIAEGYNLTGIFINDPEHTEKYAEISSNFSLITITLKSRDFLNKIFSFQKKNRLLLMIRYLITYIEYVIKTTYHATKVRAELYEAHDIQCIVPAVIVSKLHSKKFIYQAHELFAERGEPNWLSLIHKVKEKIFIRFADLVITPEKNRENIYYSERKIKNKVITIQNCPPYREKIQSRILYEEFKKQNIDVNKIVIYQGLLADDRCIDEIIASAEHYNELTKLVIIGSGFGKYIDYHKKSGTYKNVLILKYVKYDELPMYTASANIGLLIYRNTCRNNYYCAPNKLFEYIMMGLPVVASNFPGLVEIVENNQIGLCIDPTSPKEIADAVNKLVTDKELYNKMRRNCLQLSKIKFNWETEFQKLYPYYKDFLTH